VSDCMAAAEGIAKLANLISGTINPAASTASSAVATGNANPLSKAGALQVVVDLPNGGVDTITVMLPSRDPSSGALDVALLSKSAEGAAADFCERRGIHDGPAAVRIRSFVVTEALTAANEYVAVAARSSASSERLVGGAGSALGAGARGGAADAFTGKCGRLQELLQTVATQCVKALEAVTTRPIALQSTAAAGVPNGSTPGSPNKDGVLGIAGLSKHVRWDPTADGGPQALPAAVQHVAQQYEEMQAKLKASLSGLLCPTKCSHAIFPCAQAELEANQIIIRDAATREAGLSMQFGILQAQAEVARKAAQDATAHAEEMKAQLDSQRAAASEVSGSVAKLAADLDSAKREAAGYKQRVEQLSKELANAKSAYEEGLKHAQDSLARVAAEGAAFRDRVRALEANDKTEAHKSLLEGVHGQVGLISHTLQLWRHPVACRCAHFRTP
jgi:hypothetical protein